MKLGLIGTGNMGCALLRGALRSDSLSAADVVIYDHTPAHMEKLLQDYPSITPADSAVALASQCDAILLAVKPKGILELVNDISSQFHTLTGDPDPAETPLLISIAAGISLQELEESAFEGARIIRVMPNTPALIGEGTSVFSTGTNATREDAETVSALLEKSGFIKQVPESSIEAVAAISGCGPAYMYVILDALSDAGVSIGLPRPLALELATRTMLGSASLVQQSGLHPMELRDQVTSPGGTTIEALNALDRHGLRHALIEAVKAARNKSSRLG